MSTPAYITLWLILATAATGLAFLSAPLSMAFGFGFILGHLMADIEQGMKPSEVLGKDDRA